MPDGDPAFAARAGTLFRVKPVPIVFHVGPLQVHTYGIGLAITFIFAIWYAARRFRANGLPHEWIMRDGIWIVFAAIAGARILHIVANLDFYTANPGQIPLIWHGGLSSFGGLLAGVPLGMYLAHRNCPDLSLTRGLDIVAPVLIAAWAIGRILGPQFMFQGGGHPTTAWYGMQYAGQTGDRIPVPIFQSIECWIMYGILIFTERRFPIRPTGLLISMAMGMWGLGRFSDEWLWLGRAGHWDSVEAGSLILAAAGWIWFAALLLRGERKDQRAQLQQVGGMIAAAEAGDPPGAPAGSVKS